MIVKRNPPMKMMVKMAMIVTMMAMMVMIARIMAMMMTLMVMITLMMTMMVMMMVMKASFDHQKMHLLWNRRACQMMMIAISVMIRRKQWGSRCL